MEKQEPHQLVLAFSPTTRGVGYAVFEGPQNPLDWGVKETKGVSTRRQLKAVKELARYYTPDVIVIEQDEKAYRRGIRVRELLKAISNAGEQCGVRVCPIAKETIEGIFSQFGSTTKFQRAQRISSWIPDLKHLAPRERKPWMSEDYRMGIFDAMTLALTYYYLED